MAAAASPSEATGRRHEQSGGLLPPGSAGPQATSGSEPKKGGEPLAELAMPVPLEGLFTYSVPEGMRAAPGMVAAAPWGSRTLRGVVMALRQEAPPGVAVKPLAGLEPGEPLLDAALLELVAWAARYYQAPIGEVMRCALPPGRPPVSSRRAAPRRAAIAPPAWEPRPRIERLNSSQQRALAVIEAEGAAERPMLLHGVTGSGKTAVYLAAIEAALGRGE